MRTIFDLLSHDHESHRTTLEALKATSGDTHERRVMFERLEHELKAHAVAEERTLYAAMLETREGQPEASHSVHEHEQIDGLLAQLREMGFDNPNWLRVLDTLAERVLHHEREEERETFVAGEKVLSGRRAEDLARDFVRIKSEELVGSQ